MFQVENIFLGSLEWNSILDVTSLKLVPFQSGWILVYRWSRHACDASSR